VSHQFIHPKKEILGKIMQIRFHAVRTATEPRRTGGRCGSYILEPQNRRFWCAVPDLGTGTAPFRGLAVT